MLARKHSSYFVICAISHILNFLQSDIVGGVKLSRYGARSIPREEYSLVRRIHGNGKTIFNPWKSSRWKKNTIAVIGEIVLLFEFEFRCNGKSNWIWTKDTV